MGTVLLRVARAAFVALITLLVLVPLAADVGGHPANGRQGSCGPPQGGTLPTVTSVTVGGVAIPAGSDSSKPGPGKLYYQSTTGDGQINGGDCLYPWTIRIMRDYTGAGPDSGWQSVVGTAPFFLDHAAYARKFNPAYADDPVVTEDTKVVIAVTLPGDGSYAAQNAYWFTTNGKLDGNAGISLNGSTLSISGYPRNNINTAEQWPNNLPADFNALTVDASTYYNQFGGLNNWGGGQPNGYGQNGAFGPGGTIAQASSYGLQFSVTARFAAGPLGKGSEEQRGSWFEAVNTPYWSTMYSNQGGSLTLQSSMGNYSEYYTGETNTVTKATGALRMMLPDAWTQLGFGVTSASDPALIQGAIQVTRTESGTTTPVAATTSAVPGVGIVVDVGTVAFSNPSYKTKRNTTVRAQRKGKGVRLSFRLTAAQVKAAKGKVTIWAGKRKLKKIATVRAKKGKNSTSVRYIKRGGYAVKVGKTTIGSATIR